MRPYSTVRGWLVRMMRRGLSGRFDRKSTGRKKILGPQTLKKIMEWTRWDPSKYGFESASWHLDMVNEMLRREIGMHARPRTLRRILLLFFPIFLYNAWALARYLLQHSCPGTRITLKMAVRLFLVFVKELSLAKPPS